MDLERALSALRRRLWPVLLVSLVAAVTAAALVSLRPPVYESTAQVAGAGAAQLRGQAGDATSGSPAEADRALQNELVVARGVEVARGAAARLGRDDVDQLREDVSVEQVTGTDILSVTGRGATATEAAAVAQAWARAYTEVRAEQRRTTLRRTADAVDRQLADLNGRIADAGSGATQRALRDALLEQYQALVQRQQGLRSEAQLQSSDVLSAAEVPQAPSGPQPLLWGALAAVLAGLLVGAFLVLREQYDDTVRSPGDLEAFGGDVIGELPGRGTGPFRRRRPAAAPDYREQIQAAAAAILLRDPQPQLVGIRGGGAAAPAGGAPADDLARALASAGKRTYLLPGVAVPGPGPSVPSNGAGASRAALVPGAPAGGPSPLVLADGPEGTSTMALRRRLLELKQSGAVVVVHAPPATRGAQSSVAAATADLLVLVVLLGRTRRRQVTQTLALRKDVPATPVAWLLAAPSTRSRRRPAAASGRARRRG